MEPTSLTPEAHQDAASRTTEDGLSTGETEIDSFRRARPRAQVPSGQAAGTPSEVKPKCGTIAQRMRILDELPPEPRFCRHKACQEIFLICGPSSGATFVLCRTISFEPWVAYGFGHTKTTRNH